MSSSIETTPTMESHRSFSEIPIKIRSNAQFKRSLFSSLRVKKKTERPTFNGLYGTRPSDSRWSLYSANSMSTEDFNWYIQPNYLKMMNDTNLMDNCAAAEMEMESVPQQLSSTQLEFLKTNKSKIDRTTVDPDQLLQWIVYMEKYLEAFSPTWKEVDEMNDAQRNASLNEQCDLRQYIASHNRIFNQMIKEQNNQRTSHVKEKYHMLLLNAIEKQCLLEGYPKVDDDRNLTSYDNANVKLDVYKLCSIDIEPQSDHQLDYTLIRSTESLDSISDAGTIITSDDGINFPTHPTTSKSSLYYSEDHYSPFSSHPDFKCESQSWENIIKDLDNIDIDIDINGHGQSCTDLHKIRKASNSSISESTMQLIKNVDSVLPKVPTPNLDEYFSTNNKVDDWLFHHPNSQSKDKKRVDVVKKMNNNICSSSSGSDRSCQGSAMSIQWDNFQDFYTLTVPAPEEPNNDFLYFGDDYDDALKCKRGSSSTISDLVKTTTTSTPTTPSKSEKSSRRDETGVSNETRTVCRKRKRATRKSTRKNTSTVIQPSIPYENSEMARDILLITENLRENYTNLKPRDFDGILKICRENLGCLIVVLDKEQRSHYRSNESIKSVGDDKIYIQESCRCGIIGRFVARIVNFLYECGRKAQRTVLYRFFLKMLKSFYAMVKFLSQKVRVYRTYYGKY